MFWKSTLVVTTLILHLISLGGKCLIYKTLFYLLSSYFRAKKKRKKEEALIVSSK